MMLCVPVVRTIKKGGALPMRKGIICQKTASAHVNIHSLLSPIYMGGSLTRKKTSMIMKSFSKNTAK